MKLAGLPLTKVRCRSEFESQWSEQFIVKCCFKSRTLKEAVMRQDFVPYMPTLCLIKTIGQYYA